VDLSLPLCRVAACRKPLNGRRTAYCSDQHARLFQRDHVWADARRAARRRSKWACERCGFKPSEARKDPELRAQLGHRRLRLEVNHRQPLGGTYRTVTCLNHQANLEVLCHGCHAALTAASRRAAADAG
jgi:hypothetical protein